MLSTLIATKPAMSAPLEHVSQAMYEISTCLPNSSLEALSQTPFWSAILAASRDQCWWHRRVEHLLGRTLEYKQGDWPDVYRSLERCGPVFQSLQNYSDDLLVCVLLEIKAELEENELPLSYSIAEGINPALLKPVIRHLNNTCVDPDSILGDACHCGRLDIVEACLEMGAKPQADAFIFATEQGHARILERLLDSNCPSSQTIRELSLVKRAIRNRRLETLRVLLSNERVMAARPASSANLHMAIRMGEIEMVRLLVKCPTVDPYEDRDSLRYSTSCWPLAELSRTPIGVRASSCTSKARNSDMDDRQGGILAHDVLANIASKLDDRTLGVLYAMRGLGKQLTTIAQTDDFWYQRTVNLTNRDLIRRPDVDWKDIYRAVKDTTPEQAKKGDYSLAFGNLDALQVLEELYGPLEIKQPKLGATVFTGWLGEVSDPRVFDYLLTKYPDARYTFWGVLDLQLQKQNREIIDKLLPLAKQHPSQGVSTGALQAAARAGDLKSLRYLLEEVAVPIDEFEERDLAVSAVQSDNLDTYEYVRARYPEALTDVEVLERAIAADAINIFRDTFERGVYTESDKNRILASAFYGNSDPSHTFAYLTSQIRNPDWIRLLERAIKAGLPEIAEQILSHIPPETDLVMLPWTGRYRDGRSAKITALILARSDPVPRLREIVEKIGESDAFPSVPAIALMRDERVKVQDLPRDLALSLFRMVEQADFKNPNLREQIGRGGTAGEQFAADSSSVAGDDVISLVHREMVLKRPSKPELIDWMISLDDPDLEQASADIIDSIEWVPERLIPLNCLLLAMLYPTLARQEQLGQLATSGMSRVTLLKTDALLTRYEFLIGLKSERQA